VLPTARFCEACGSQIPRPGSEAWSVREAGFADWPAPSSAAAEGSGEATRRRVLERGRIEVALPDLAGVSDRGLQRHDNQDAMALARVEGRGARILVVCDGVATSGQPAAASQAAARAALAYLVDAVERDEPDPAVAMRRAVGAAHRAVCAVAERIGAHDDPPASTLVAGLIRDGQATVGWVGDSRAYLFDAAEGRQLTSDHSWAAEQVRLGVMSEAQAAADPRAHALTGWLGGDVRRAVEASVVSAALPAAGCLLLCTDGLWNYARSVMNLRELMLRFSADDPLEVARQLTEFARSSGGEDNITVAVAFA
jgi:PPM family protein phosphatase